MTVERDYRPLAQRYLRELEAIAAAWFGGDEERLERLLTPYKEDEDDAFEPVSDEDAPKRGRA